MVDQGADAFSLERVPHVATEVIISCEQVPAASCNDMNGEVERACYSFVFRERASDDVPEKHTEVIPQMMDSCT